MGEDAQIKSVALFYYFGLLEEAEARIATRSTYRQLQKSLRVSGEKKWSSEATVVHLTNKYWKKHKKKMRRGQPSISIEAGWKLPDGIDLGAWKQFQKEADDDEFLALLWSKILSFSDEQVSRGLGVTRGTVRHRVSRGLRHLGRLFVSRERVGS